MENSSVNILTYLFVQWCNELAYAHITLMTMCHMLIDWTISTPLWYAGEPCWSLTAQNADEVERFFKETIENRSAKIYLDIKTVTFFIYIIKHFFFPCDFSQDNVT